MMFLTCPLSYPSSYDFLILWTLLDTIDFDALFHSTLICISLTTAMYFRCNKNVFPIVEVLCLCMSP